MSTSPYYKTIGLARENESPENPGALEKRVALIPRDVKQLTDAGCRVYVEQGAGEGVGFSDEEYIAAGAEIQSTEEIYAGKDLLIKFKGPAMEHIPLMRKGCALFCMAHFHSFPDRAKALEEHQITVIAMENIVETPQKRTDDDLIGRVAADAALEPWIQRNAQNYVTIHMLGYNDRHRELIRRLANHSPERFSVLQAGMDPLVILGDVSQRLFVYDSELFPESEAITQKLEEQCAYTFDVAKFCKEYGDEAIHNYRSMHKPWDTGLRRIQCLHETGMAGARYGFTLLKGESPLKLEGERVKATVLGFGNVGMGSINECYRQGVKQTHVLGRPHTTKERISSWLSDSDLVVNGAEQPAALRGKNFLVTNEHLKSTLRDGSVVIDLIGGSATNRSPVEPLVECTYLTDPHFLQDDVFVSGLWGWPMMGMMKETAIKYSGQIADVLLGDDEHLIGGLGDNKDIHPGLKPAVVCGPFSV